MTPPNLKNKIFLLFIISFLIFLTHPCLSYGLPEGEKVVSGSASFDRSQPNTLKVKTPSGKLIVNYNSFSVASSEAVHFHQPSSSSVALNRVVGGVPSEIFGTLTANGKIFLVNPNGILFGRTARVDTAGLLATTLDISNQDFLSGKYNFHLKDGTSPSYVVNRGRITVDEHGFVVLASPLVSNEGEVLAQGGEVVISGTEAFSLSFDEQNLINFVIPKENRTCGTVTLPKSEAFSLITKTLNTEGIVKADRIVEEEGVIKLTGTSGIAINSGSVVTSAGGQGSAGNVLINSSQDTVLAEGAQVRADAADIGSGGRIKILSGGDTSLEGVYLSARGGSLTGDGGYIEVSAENKVIFGGVEVDLSSPYGNKGELLVDPDDFDITGNVYSHGTDLNYQADKSITVADGLVISSRDIIGPDTKQAHLLNPSKGDSGDIDFSAPSIDIGSRVDILAFADGAHSGGDVSLTAVDTVDLIWNATPEFKLKSSEANINIGASSLIKAQNISLLSRAATSKLVELGDDVSDLPDELGYDIDENSILDFSVFGAAVLCSAKAKVHIHNSAVLSADNDVVINSQSYSNASMKTVGLYLGVTYGRSEAVAQSLVDSNVNISAGNSVSVTAATSNTINLKTYAGSASSKGVDISFTYGKGISRSNAIVDSNATVEANDINVDAVNNNDFFVGAGTFDLESSDFGAGASVVISDMNSSATASLNGNVSADNNIIVNADSINVQNKASASATATNPVQNKAVVGTLANKTYEKIKKKKLKKKSNAKLDLAAAVTFVKSQNEADSHIADGADVDASGDITVTSRAEDNYQISAAGSAGDGKIAVGGAVAFGDYENTANAYIGDNATVDARGALTVSSQAVVPSQMTWINDWSFDYNWPTFSGGDTTGEFIDNAWNLGVDTIIEAVGTTLNTVSGYLNLNFGVADKISTTYTQCSASGEKVGLAGAVSFVNTNNVSEAYIGKGAQVNTDPSFYGPDQNVLVKAYSSIDEIDIAGLFSIFSFGFGTVGKGSVGGSYIGGLFKNTAKAYIKDGASVNARKNSSDVSDKNDIKINAETQHRKLSIAEAGGKSDKFTISGGFNSLDLENTALAYAEDTANLYASHDMDLYSKNEATTINIVAGLAKSDAVGVGVGASWNNIDNVSKAFIGSVEDSALAKGVVDAGSDVSLHASSSDDLYAFSLAGSAGGQFGIKNKLGNLFKGIIGKVKGAGSDDKAEGEENDDEKSSSEFGLGISGDASLNFATDIVEAYIADGVSVNAGGDINLTAENFSTMLSVAAAAAGAKKAGLGGTFSHNNISKTTKAFTSNVTINTPKDIDVASNSGNSLVSISGGGSGSQKVALAGAANTNWISNDTEAALGDSTKVNSADNIWLNADNYNKIISVALAVMGSGKVGIGGAVDFGVIDNDIFSFLGDDSDVTTQGNIILMASSDDNIIPVSATFGGAGKVGLTGAAESYTITNDTYSFAGARAKVRTNKNFLADADDNTDIIGVAGAAAGGGKAGVAAAVFNANIIRNVKAYIGKAADLTAKAKGNDPITLKSHNTHGVELDAASNDDLKTFAAAGSGGGKAGVAGAINEKTVVSTTEAYIADNARVNALDNSDGDDSQSVMLRAYNSTGILGIGGAASGGGTAGVGASADADILVKNTKSYIGSNAEVRAKDNIASVAESKEDVVSISAGAAGGGTAGVAGAASALVVVNNTLSYIDSGGDVEAEGNIVLTAQDDTDSNLFVGSAAGGGTAGVGGSVAANTVINNTKAFIADGATVTAKAKRDFSDVYDGEIDVPTLDLSVTLPDGNDFDFGIGELTDSTKETKQFKGLYVNAFATEDLRNIVAGGTGGGTAGVAGTLSANVVVNNTQAYIGKNVNINNTSDGGAEQSVGIAAFDYTGINGYGGVATGGGTAGVGGSDDTAVVFKNTSTWVDEGSSVNAKKDIDIIAKSLERISSMTVGLSGGGTAAVNGAASLALVKSDTHAFTASVNDKNKRVNLESGNDILVDAQDTSKIFQFAGVAGGAGTAAVGGSLAVAVLENDITAELGDFTNSNAKGKTKVTANSEENPDTFAIGATGAGTAGVAGSIAVRIMDVDTQAQVGDNAEVNQDGSFAVNGQSVEVSSLDTVKVLGIAGVASGGGTAGVGGSLDLTIVKNRALADIGKNSKVYSEDGLDDTDGILVKAESNKVIDSLAIAGTGAGTAAVAGAVSIVSVGSKFEDDVQNHLTGKDDEGNDVSTADYLDDKGSSGTDGQFGSVGDIQFTDSEGSNTTLANFLEDNSSVSVSGDMNETSDEPLTDTAAYIGDGAQVRSKGEVDVFAKDALTVNMAGGSAMGAGTAAVGGAGAFMLTNNTTRAFIGDNAKVDAMNLVNVNAESSERIIDATVALGGAGTAAVVGSLLLNIINTGTYAYIDSGAEVNQDASYKGNGQSVSVEADSKTVLTALGGTGGAAGTAGVGATAVVNTVVKDTKASIGKSAKVNAQKQVSVIANAAEGINTGAVSLQGGGVAGVGGVISVNTLVNTTESLIDENAVVDSEGNILVFAEDDSCLSSLSGSGNIAGVAAVGGSVSINTIVKQTLARIADSAVVNARGEGDYMDVYTGELEGDSDTPFAGGVVNEWGKMIDSVKNYNQTRTPVNEDGKETRKMKGLAVTSSSTEDIFSITTGIGGAITAAVTGAGSVNTIVTTTEASIGKDVKINENNASASSEQEVYLNSSDHSRIFDLLGVVAGAVKVGVGGGITSEIISKNVRAFIDGSSAEDPANQKNIVRSKGDITVNAISSDHIDNIAMNLSVGGIAGVGGVIAANAIANQVESYIGDKGKVYTDKNLSLYSKDKSKIDVISGNGAFGIGGGVGGAVAVNVIANSTRSWIGDDAMTNAKGLTDVYAQAKEEVEPIVIAGGAGGLVGVAGSINVDVIKSTTQARISDNARINQDNSYAQPGQSVEVRAKDSAAISSNVGGGGVAVGIGAGGAADVNILRNSATAHIGDNARVKAYDDILVQAHTDKTVHSNTGSVGAGVMSGMAGSVSIAVIGGGLNQDARDSLGGSANGESGDSIEFADNFLSFNPIEEEENGFESDGKEHWSKGYESTEDTSDDFSQKNDTSGVSSDVDAQEENQPLSSTQAFIGEGAVVEAGRDLTVDASDTSLSSINAGGLGVGFDSGLAGAVAVNLLSNSTEAYIKSNATTKAGRNTTITSQEDETADTVSVSGGLAVLEGAASSYALTVVDSKTKAHINSNAVVNPARSDSDYVKVGALSTTNINSIVGGGAGGVLAGIGSAYNVGVIAKTTEAYLGEGSSVKAAKQIELSSKSKETVDDWSAVFSAGGLASEVFPYSVHSVNNNTFSRVKKNANVDTDGTFKVSAQDDTALKSIVGSASVAGLAGIGGALNVNVITSNTQSYIDDGSVIRAKGDYDAVDAYTGGLIDDSDDTTPITEDQKKTASKHGLLVTAFATEDILADTTGLSVGNGSITGAVGVEVIKTETDAHIGNNVKVNENEHTLAQQDVYVLAADHTDLSSFAQALSGSLSFGSGIAIDTGIFSKNTQAYIGSNSTVKAGGNITVKAFSREDTIAKTAALAGSLISGLAGSVSVRFLSNSTRAYVGQNSSLDAGGNIEVSSSDESSIDLKTGSASAGLGAGFGGAVSVAVISNSTLSYLDENSSLTSGAGVNVKANSKETIDSTTVAGSGAGLAGVAGSVSVNVITSQTRVYTLGDVGIDADGDVSLTAADNASITGLTGGGALSLGLGVGAGVEIDIIRTQVGASLGENNNVSADNFSLEANSLKTINSQAISAAAGLASGISGAVTVALAGSVLSGDDKDESGDTSDYVQGQVNTDNTYGYASDVQGTDVEDDISNLSIASELNSSSRSGETYSYVGNASVIEADNNVSVISNDTTDLSASSKGFGVGLLGIGGAFSASNVDIESKAGTGDDVGIKAKNVEIHSYAHSTNYAQSISKTAGALSGVAAVALTANNVESRAYVGEGGPSHIIEAETFLLEAEQDTEFNSRADASQVSVVGASGAWTNNSANLNTIACIGTGAQILADQIKITSSTNVEKPWLSDFNVFSGSGGVFNGTAASSKTNIYVSTSSNIGQGAQLTMHPDASNPEDIELSALNDLNAYDRAKLDAGGLISVALAKDSLKANKLNASVDIGNGAYINSLEDIKIIARSNAEMESRADTSTYGLAAAGQGSSTALVDSLDRITFGQNSEAIATKQMHLLSGSDENTISRFKVKATTDVFNKTAFAYSGTPTADATARHYASIDIESGSHVASGSHMYLVSSKGLLLANGQGKASDASKKALEKLADLFGADADGSLDTLGGSSINEGLGSITLEGKLETGIYKDLELTFGTSMFNPYYTKSDGTKGRYTIGYDEEGGFWAVYDGENRLRILTPDVQSKGISWTILTDQKIVDNIQQEIDRLENVKRQYGANSELAQDIQARIDILKAELSTQDSDELVDIIEVNPAYAASGNINMWSDYLVGNGDIVAPGDVKIEITNNSPMPLKLNSLTIPDDMGGEVMFNNHLVQDSAAISSLNEGAPQGSNVNFSIQDASNSSDPLVKVENNFNKDSGVYNPDNIPDIADPALFISGPISNINGTVSVTNTTGSIIATADIRADTIQLSAGGDFIFDSPQTLYNIGPNPAAGFKYLVDAYENDVSPKPSYHGQEGADSFQIAGNNIYINADTVNINGVIQSGLPDKAIVITQADIIAAYQKATLTGKRFVEIKSVNPYLNPGDRVVKGGISAELDAQEDRINILGADVQGGLVFISGRIVSTGDGKINVLDGYGKINIENQTILPVVLKDVDTAGVEGRVILVDKARNNGIGLYLVTEYRRLGDEIQVYSNRNINSTIATHLDFISTGRDTNYTPLDNMRYFWMDGKATSAQTIKKWYKRFDKFLGFIPVGSRTFTSKDYVDGYPQTRTLSGDELPQGDFVAQKAGDDYTYERMTVTTKNDLISQDDDDGTYWTWKRASWWPHPWYPVKRTWWKRTQVWDKGTNTYNYHSVKADCPIDISFIGYDQGEVKVNSGGSILLAGNLNNSGGITQLNSTAGNIFSESDFASVKSAQINLEAPNGSIGQEERYFKITHSGGNILNASAKGDIYIASASGDLYLTSLNAVSGSVGLIADKGLFLSNVVGLIKGKNIYLEARRGVIGSAGNVIRVDTDAENGGVIDVIAAKGDINLVEVSGNLAIDKISASGDVNIYAPGDIVDANSNEKSDTRTRNELLALWDDMQLTGSGAEDKKQSQWGSYSNTMNQEYQKYWQEYRHLTRKPDGTYSWDVYDPNVGFHYSQEERQSLEDSGWKDEDINNLENDLTQKYRAWGNSDYNPNFSYALTDTEKDDISSGYFWTQKQLEGGLPSFILTKDTTLSIEEPNITGNNVSVAAGGAIGKDKDDLIFDFSASYTPDEMDDIKLAITSAERDDLEWYSDHLVIHRREDLDIHAPGKIFLTATGHIFLGSEHDVNVYSLNAGGRVRVKVGGNIFNPRTDAFSDFVASEGIILEASGGQIGTSASPARITLSGASPYITARAEGDIYIKQPSGDMYLDIINAGGTASLSAPSGSIFDWLEDSTTNIYADNINLTALNSVGNPLGNNGALDVELTDANGYLKLNTQTGGAYILSNRDLTISTSDIYADFMAYSMGGLSIAGDTVVGGDVDFTSKGDMVFSASLEAKGNLVNLNPSGQDIVDGNNNTYIWADGLIINNSANIGSAVAGGALDTRIRYVTIKNGSGDVYLREVPSGGALELRDISSKGVNIKTTGGNLNLFSKHSITVTGEVVLDSPRDIVLNGMLGDASVITLRAGRNIIDNSNDTKYIKAGKINIENAINIGSSGQIHWLDIDVDTLNISNTPGDAFIGDKGDVTIGNITLGSSLKFTAQGSIAAGSINCGGDANIRSYGAISDANGNLNNITARNLRLRAESGIGANDAIDTAVTNLDVVNTANEVRISNTGELTLADLNNDGFSVTNTNSAVNISASSPLNVANPVSAAKDITLSALEDGGNDDILTVNANITSTNGGAITLNSGADFKQVTGNITTSGDIYINADYDAGGKGDITQINGFVNAVTLIADASGNITMLHANNNVSILRANSKALGNINYYDRDDVDLARVVALNGSIDISAAGQITATDVETSAVDDGSNSISLTSLYSGIKAVSIDAGTKNGVFLTASQGAITQDGLPDLDVSSGGLTIVSQKGIDLDTKSSVLYADNSLSGDITIDNEGNLYAEHMKNEGGDINITTHSNLYVGDIKAPGRSVYLNASSGSIYDDLSSDPNDTNYIEGHLVDLTAQDDIGQSSVFNGDIDILADIINAHCGGNLSLEAIGNNTLFNDISAGGAMQLSAQGSITLGHITSNGFIDIRNLNGDITVTTGTLTSLFSGVKLTTDNGSIYAEGPGPHIKANDDSFLNAPKGKISPPGGAPLNVIINGDLYLDVANLSITYPTREVYANLIGKIIPLGAPMVKPTVFPQPLNPPGFAYFNSKQIWPPKSNGDYQMFSQEVTRRYSSFIASYRQKFYNNPRYEQDATKARGDNFESLSRTVLTPFDSATPTFYAYHPLVSIDKSAFDNISLDIGAYEFIDNNIMLKKPLNYYLGLD